MVLLPSEQHNFSLKSARIPAEKLLASGSKFLAAGHIVNVQTSPSQGAVTKYFVKCGGTVKNCTAALYHASEILIVPSLNRFVVLACKDTVFCEVASEP